MQDNSTLLFLDIDGVLNHSKCPEFQHTNKVLDPECVKRWLDFVAHLENPYIVLCSTWRSYEGHRQFLRDNGITWHETTHPPRLSMSRDSEISIWMSCQLWLGRDCDKLPFMIFDDACDSSFWGINLVCPDFQDGGLAKFTLAELITQYQSILLDRQKKK
jgi:hypothetical protein